MRAEVDQVIAKGAQRMRDYGIALREGRISLESWRAGMRQEIKTQHLMQAMAAKGGRDRMTQSDYGRVGRLLRAQYSFLEGFTADIAKGLPIDGRIAARSAMYASSARMTYHAIERTEMLVHGWDEERNILVPGENCRSCLAETKRDFVPLGDLSAPGTRECHVNCRCRIQYRNSATGEVSAA